MNVVDYYQKTGMQAESRRALWEFPYTADEFFEHWRKQIPCKIITYYPPYDRTADEEIILAVDASAKAASTHGGGGLLFFQESKIGRCYRMNFCEDLGVNIDEGVSWESEMLNLLFSLCIFKQTLINRKKIRIICDNEKIRNEKRSPIVQSIRKIIEYLKSEGAFITNDLDNSYTFYPNNLFEERLIGIVDRISKGKPIPEFKDEYALFKGNDFYELKKDLNKKYTRFFSGNKMMII